jgi:Uma2 family endonuclease
MLRLDIILPVDWHWSDQQLFEFCQTNKGVRIERDADGQIYIMAPSGGYTSNLNANLVGEIIIWAKKTNLGRVFDSNGGFLLPNGAMRAPDAAFVRSDRWEALTEEEKEKFPPLCPDFVIELKSPSDRLAPLQEKMKEWIDNGCQLAWLIAPKEAQVYIYRADGSISIVKSFTEKLSGEEVLPGFELELGVLV